MISRNKSLLFNKLYFALFALHYPFSFQKLDRSHFQLFPHFFLLIIPCDFRESTLKKK